MGRTKWNLAKHARKRPPFLVSVWNLDCNGSQAKKKGEKDVGLIMIRAVNCYMIRSHCVSVTFHPSSRCTGPPCPLNPPVFPGLPISSSHQPHPLHSSCDFSNPPPSPGLMIPPPLPPPPLPPRLSPLPPLPPETFPNQQLPLRLMRRRAYCSSTRQHPFPPPSPSLRFLLSHEILCTRQNMLTDLKKATDTEHSAHTVLPSPPWILPSLAQHLDANRSFDDFCSTKETYFGTANPPFFLFEIF